MRMVRLSAVVALVACCVGPAAGEADFMGLGNLGGEAFFSEAYGISADGLVVVGVRQLEVGEYE